ncbi:NAD(P)-dependent oxidoreductase [Microbulbifer flavimaris]|uniref:NAD(P)-dependent oxidoreductase n=1 Tax=Microbulbifer flavimaris TaxID=1781068 RepID=A0ABX4I232_9GAMM|nr:MULTISPECIES: NAD(P)-dependent oxidoreductase [Microbulbifer]KUJ84381.1 oxidoreductase [Microbulbifer sp. ZGT114]PCO06465.1 NAD(P)-dependent oxidoreductase [Microbulbifer flavimaris]
MATVAFLGLGVMGYPMAGFLARAGHKVRVFNRTASRAQQWLGEYPGEAFETPAEAARGAELVFACVGNDNDLREVVTGEQGAFAGMRQGSLFVDHTTASADVARELAAAGAERGLGFLDAPVSGGQAGAENGALTIMVGGAEADYQRAQPFLQCYARASNLLGPVGSGQLCKMVNQICIAGVVQGLAEGLHFAGAAGLDAEQVVDVISKGAAQSWQMENRYKTMLAGEYEHGFAVDWMRKDLAIVLDEAQRNGALLPVTALVDQFYSEVQALGGGRWDTSSLFARLTNVRSFEDKAE